MQEVWEDLDSKFLSQVKHRSYIHETSETPKTGLSKPGTAECLLTNFEVFGSWIKHSLECLI